MRISTKIIFNLVFLLIVTEPAIAQPRNKIDSIYYLIDTAKTPTNARMWNIGVEMNYKYYEILCPCLAYGQNPNFIYKEGNKGKLIGRKELKLIKQINLTSLIQKAKLFTNKTFTGKYAFFFIEPKDKSYIIQQVHLTTPINREPIIDYDVVHPVDTSKHKKP